jgi:hypothetical protein
VVDTGKRCLMTIPHDTVHTCTYVTLCLP